MSSHHLAALEAKIEPLTRQLAEHRLYCSFEDGKDVRRFTEAHVFAVWDFMCLLKTLQRGLTCVEVPWLPSAMPESRRLINEIVFGEESDVYEGEPFSHFEIYRLAMIQCGADTAAIDHLLASLTTGAPWTSALASCGAPEPARRFVEATFRIIEAGKLHATAAAFTFGREDLIPEMFRGFLRDQSERFGGQFELLRWYMERHIEVDGEEHGPMALRMVSELCGGDDVKWTEATEAALSSLTARLALWDGIADVLQESRATLLHR